MTTKIRIDLSSGVIEVEGSEEFVLSVYNDHKSKLIDLPAYAPPTTHATPIPERQGSGTRKAPPPKAKGTTDKAGASKANLKKPAIIKSLDLTKGSGGRLRDFYDQFEVKTNFERNLIFLYFLQYKMGIEHGITQDHVFTCYRDIPGIKVPTALRQSLLDTESDRHWIDVADSDNLKITVHGLNYLEHDMLRKKPKQ